MISPNLIITGSNIAALPAILIEFENQQFIRAFILIFTTLVSVAYHLIEYKNNGIPGYFPAYRRWDYQQLAIKIDNLATGLVILVYLPKMYDYTINKGYDLFWWSICSIFMMIVSESFEHVRCYFKIHCEKNDIESQLVRKIYTGLKEAYMITHCLWHVTQYLTILELARI